MPPGPLHGLGSDEPLFWGLAVAVAPAAAAAAAVSVAAAVAVAVAVAVAPAVLFAAPVDEELVESGDDQRAVGFVPGLNCVEGDHGPIIPWGLSGCTQRAGGGRFRRVQYPPPDFNYQFL